MTPQPILFASWYIGLGGGETDLVTLAQGMDHSQYTPHLLLPREGQLAEVWREMGFPVHILGWRGATTWFVPRLWAQFPVVRRMESLIREHKIALVHSDYHALPLIAPAAQRANVPVVWTVWGWWFRPKPWQRDFFRRFPAVARSRIIRDGFLGDPPFRAPESVPVVYPGIETDRFSPAVDGQSLRDELDIPAETPLVAMVGRFQEVKGHATFQAMIRLLAEHVPDARFIVAGESVFGVSSETAHRDHILAVAKTDPVLKTRLRYIGFRRDVERVLAAADVVVCPSDFETFGKVNLEAMACGTPVVSTNRGGPAETVLEGETGYLVPPRDPAALADRVRHLLLNPAVRAQMGKNGRQHVMRHFAAETGVRQYVDIFQKALTEA